MSTNTEISILGTTLFGKTRRAVLTLLYSHPDESFYLRQIARTTGAGMGALQRELKQLAEAGIGGFQAAVAHQVALVIGQLDASYTEVVEARQAKLREAFEVAKH